MTIWYVVWFLAGMLIGAVVDWGLIWVVSARRVKADPEYHEPKHAPGPGHEPATGYIDLST